MITAEFVSKIIFPASGTLFKFQHAIYWDDSDDWDSSVIVSKADLAWGRFRRKGSKVRCV